MRVASFEQQTATRSWNALQRSTTATTHKTSFMGIYLLPLLGAVLRFRLSLRLANLLDSKKPTWHGNEWLSKRRQRSKDRLTSVWNVHYEHILARRMLPWRLMPRQRRPRVMVAEAGAMPGISHCTRSDDGGLHWSLQGLGCHSLRQQY